MSESEKEYKDVSSSPEIKSETTSEMSTSVSVSSVAPIKRRKRRSGLFKASTYNIVERILNFFPRDDLFHAPFDISRMTHIDPRTVERVFNLIKVVREFPYDISFAKSGRGKTLMRVSSRKRIDEFEKVKMLLSESIKYLDSKSEESK